MDSTGALALFRSEMNDAEAPYLWSDVDVFGYLDDAQKMFCRLTDGIGDGSTVAVTNVTVDIDADWVDLHPSILKIRGANRASDGSIVRVINFEDMGHEEIRFDGRKGPFARIIIGMEENRARVHPIATIADTINLLVFRLPLKQVVATADVSSTTTDQFEIPDQHHPHLLHWAKHRAYQKQDAECFDRTKATEFEEKFRKYCADVKTEQSKKRHKPRSVSYGGI